MENKDLILTAQGAFELEIKICDIKAKIERLDNSIARIIKNSGVFDELYSERIELKAFLQSELEEFEYVLKNSQIVPSHSKINRDAVEIGNIVEISSTELNASYTIVSSLEANPVSGKISAESPIGASLLGKHLGEEVIIKLPTKEFVVKITRIS